MRRWEPLGTIAASLLWDGRCTGPDSGGCPGFRGFYFPDFVTVNFRRDLLWGFFPSPLNTNTLIHSIPLSLITM